MHRPSLPPRHRQRTHEHHHHHPGPVSSRYLSSDERQDVHLASVGVFDGGDDEAGATQGDLPLGPAVDGQRQLPFPHVEHPGELHALRAADTPGLPWGEGGA